MHIKTIEIVCFIAGIGGFLLLFKIFFLKNTGPQDELAPGVVMLMAMLIGLLSSYVGRRIQKLITRI